MCMMGMAFVFSIMIFTPWLSCPNVVHIRHFATLIFFPKSKVFKSFASFLGGA